MTLRGRVRSLLHAERFASTLVVPGQLTRLRPLATWLIASIRTLAERVCIGPIAVSGWCTGANPRDAVDTEQALLERKTCLVVSVRFLLMHAPPALALVQRAAEGSLVLYGNRSSGDLLAVAFRASRPPPDLGRLLGYLTRCDGRWDEDWTKTPDATLVDEANTPAARARPDAYAAWRLNTALRELVGQSWDDGAVDGEPDRLAR